MSSDKESVLAVAKNKKLPSDAQEIIKEPMYLEFLGLKHEAGYYEKDLEQAIITHFQEFLSEKGNVFSFVNRFFMHLPLQKLHFILTTYFETLRYHKSILRIFKVLKTEETTYSGRLN